MRDECALQHAHELTILYDKVHVDTYIKYPMHFYKSMHSCIYVLRLNAQKYIMHLYT